VNAICKLLCFMALAAAPHAHAKWHAANSDVEAAAKDSRIAAVLKAVDEIDAALVEDDPKAFAALLDDDLAVNNPQNSISVRGATTSRSSAGLISYSRYDRSVEYAGTRGDLVILMGEETVVPKGGHPQSGKVIKRRFTDVWRPTERGWKLTARQATIISSP
jgi:ketosteroid isomerase-like protein